MGDKDGVAKADGNLMSTVVLRLVPGEGISARLVFPHVGNVLQGAPVGKAVEEAQKLPVNPTRCRHDTNQKGLCGARPVGIGLAVPWHLGARRGREDPPDTREVKHCATGLYLVSYKAEFRMPRATTISWARTS